MPTPARAARPAAPPLALPSYALYGEAGRTQATDWLHCERIADRSQRHDWEIAPHRHESLFQILHMERGAAQLTLEGRQLPMAGPGVLLVPALVPHGFVFEPGTEGTVITVLASHLASRLAPAPDLASRLMRPQLLQALGTEAAAELARAVQGLHQQFALHGAWRELALDAALLHLAVLLGRAVQADAPATEPAQSSRAVGHVRRYQALVESRYRQQPTLAALARALGITPTQLNRVCHQVLGHSALGVLHGRLLLEAQRDLAYTTLSIKQIGLSLGFADAGYFTRFFQRLSGHTPTAWRALTAR